jgi:hypothetical protein
MLCEGKENLERVIEKFEYQQCIYDNYPFSYMSAFYDDLILLISVLASTSNKIDVSCSFIRLELHIVRKIVTNLEEK